MSTLPPTGGRVTRAFLTVWTLVGAVALLYVGLIVLAAVRLAVLPLVLALFPAALLAPVSDRLRRRLPPAVAAGLVVLGFVALLGSMVWLLGRLLVNEAPSMIEAVEEAYGDLTAFAADKFGLELPHLDEALERAEEWARGQELGEAGRSFVFATFEVLTTILLTLVTLFFYLKDRGRMFRFVVALSPARARDAVTEIGYRVWETIGGYFRGQLLVAAVDALLIGSGLLLLGVPLALPLALLIFIGGLFPIVGAFTAGALAVLVALAHGGPVTALIVLALNVVVQQLEGNLLEPLVVGRATQLHPLVVLVALTAGAVTLGVLGAFLAVPLTAAVVRAVGYLVESQRGATPVSDPTPSPPR